MVSFDSLFVGTIPLNFTSLQPALLTSGCVNISVFLTHSNEENSFAIAFLS
jgi:hypothetical protein